MKEEIKNLFAYDIPQEDKEEYFNLPLEEMLDMAELELDEDITKF